MRKKIRVNPKAILIVPVLGLVLLLLIVRPSKNTQPTFKKSLFSSTYSTSLPSVGINANLGVSKDGAIIKLSRENSTLSLNIPLAQAKLQKDKEELVYSVPEKVIETRYRLLNNGLKEEIVLLKKPGNSKFTSELNVKNLVIKTTPAGIPVFYDSRTGEYQFHFERPFAKDAKGAVTYGVSYTLTPKTIPPLRQDFTKQAGKKKLLGELIPVPQEQNTIYILTTSVDPDWLHDPSRAYPITVDPTITHDTTGEFDDGTLNRVKDTGSPNLESYYHELPADIYTVGLWHMNESSGTTVADSSNNGNNATSASSANISTGILNNTRIFDGTSGTILTRTNTPSLQIPGAITIEAWVKLNNTNNQVFISKTSGRGGLYLGLISSKFVFGNYNVDNTPASTTTPSTGIWYHLAGVYDGTTRFIYVNGTLEAQSSTNATNWNNTNALIIGAGNAAYYVNGQIDEVRISNIARSPEEIKADAQRRPYGVYTSDVIDLTQNVVSWNSLSWTEVGVGTGDGEAPFDTSSLVAQWNFNEISGTTATNNAGSCGSACNGTLTNFANTSGQDVAAGSGWTSANKRWGNGALMFDGTDDYVSITNNISLNIGSSFSAEIWVKTSTMGFMYIYRKLVSSAEDKSMAIDASGKALFYLYNTFGGTGLVSNKTVTDGQWHYIVATYDGSTAKIYIDGLLDNSKSASGDVADSNGNLIIGGSTAGGYFRGVIDSLRWYSRPLTASEILANYNAGNIELQTRVGSDASPDDGSWEEWRPITSESTITSMDSDQSNWSWDNTATYMPKTKANESTIKVEGDGSMKLKIGSHQTDANTLALWHFNENPITTDDTLIANDHYDNDFPDWTPNVKYVCPYLSAMLGGYGNFDGNTVAQKTIPNLPAGIYRISFDFIKIDSWDNEYGYFTFNGVEYWRHYGQASWGGQFCGSTSSGWNEALWSGSVIVRHTGGDAVLRFGTNLNEAATNESWGIANIKVHKASINDSSGNNNHGWSFEDKTIDGFYGKGRYFDGSGDFVQGPPLNPANITLEAWVKPYDTNNRTIFSKMRGTTDPVGASWQLTSSTRFTFLMYDGSTWHSAAGTSTVSPYNWYHVAATYDGSNLRLYVNGKLEATTAYSGGISYQGTRPTTIGAQEDQTDFGIGSHFYGVIDEVRISNVARSNEEIAEAYRAGRDHRLSRTISSTDLSGKTKLPFYVASDRQGTFMEATIGESAFANYEPDANTVGLWHLEENVGTGAYIKDSAGTNNGTPDGTTLVQGKVGKARGFAGANDINLGDKSLVDSQQNLTLDGWVYTTTTDAAHHRVFSEQNVLYVGQYGTQVSFYMGNGSGWVNSSTTMGNLSANAWHYVAWVKSGTSAYVYIDGQLTGTMAAPAALGTSANVNYFSTYDGTNQPWTGYLDEMRISNVARTPEEIRQAYEVGRRSHPITIDFKAKLDSVNLISNSSDYSFTIDGTAYGAQNKGDYLYKGDKIIIKENIGGTEYLAQGTVTSIDASTGAVTVASWDAGSTFPSGGYTANATVFKWQREYFDITGSLSTHRDAVNRITFRITDGSQGANVWLDDIRSAGSYLTNPTGSTITSSTGYRYFQYRAILSSNDTAVSPSLTSVTLDYETNSPPNTPTLNSPANGAANQSLTPALKTTATDNNNDYLRYKIQLCTDQAMTQNCQTFDQTVSQTGWSGQNTQSNTAYTSGTQATYTLQTALNPGQTYYWRSYAIDPGGINLWSNTQASPYSFTTSAAPTAPTTPWCEGQSSPVTGVTDLTPEFSAVYTDTDVGDTANFYEIEVGTDDNWDSAEMWDSGKTAMTGVTAGNRSSDISYNGAALTMNGATYYWRIRFWDIAGNAGAWSDTQNFTTASLVPPASCILIKNAENTQITVRWTDTNSIEDGYQIDKATDGVWSATPYYTTAADAIEYVDSTNVSSGHSYQYRIRAKFNAAYSDWCYTPTDNLGSGSFKFDGVKMEGLQIH